MTPQQSQHDKLVEDVAKAICREEHLLMFGLEHWRVGELDSKVEHYWRKHAPAARATIALILSRLHDVTPEMEREGKEYLPVTPYRRDNSAATVWRAMLAVSPLNGGKL